MMLSRIINWSNRGELFANNLVSREMSFAYKRLDAFLHSNILYLLTDHFSLSIMVFGNINWITVYKYRCYKQVKDSEIADDRVYK